MTKRLLLTSIAAFLAVCVVPSASLAYTGTGTSYPLIVIDNSSGAQAQPHVSGRYATYTVSSGINEWIGYFDFVTQTTGVVPQTSDDTDSQADVFNNTIVFTRFTNLNPSSRIDSMPVGGTATEVAPVAAPGVPFRSGPAIGGSTVAWEDLGLTGGFGTSEIVVDAAGVVTRLTNDSLDDLNPRVSADGSTVVWEKGSDVYAAVESGGTWNVNPVAVNSSSPDTNGSVVVYASASRIHVASLSGGGDQTIPLPPGASEAINPAISGNFVVFQARMPITYDIWVYDLGDGSLRQITNTPQVGEDETLPDISSSTSAGVTTVNVVWQIVDGATGLDVYGTQFQVSSQTPFTDQFLQALAQSTDPASPVINTGKNGRVIPVKVQISQGTTQFTDQNTPGPVTIAVSKLTTCSSSAGSDPIASYADAGQSSAGTNQFHYDTTAQAWLYNLDTKALGLVIGNCYRIDVSVNGTQITNAFAVFQPTK
jgi:hypothetical protein